jgi:hypothetical protein
MWATVYLDGNDRSVVVSGRTVSAATLGEAEVSEKIRTARELRRSDLTRSVWAQCGSWSEKDSMRLIAFLDTRAALGVINILALLGGYGAVKEPKIGLLALPVLAFLLICYGAAITFDSARRPSSLSDWLRVAGRGSIFTLWIAFYGVILVADDRSILELALLGISLASGLIFMCFGPGFLSSLLQRDQL